MVPLLGGSFQCLESLNSNVKDENQKNISDCYETENWRKFLSNDKFFFVNERAETFEILFDHGSSRGSVRAAQLSKRRQACSGWQGEYRRVDALLYLWFEIR